MTLIYNKGNYAFTSTLLSLTTEIFAGSSTRFMSLKLPPLPDTPPRPATTITMTETIKPRIGGVIAGIAWTGGKPKSVERDESELSEPRTPFCFRPISAGDGLKVYSKQTTVPTGTKLFARTDPLTAFEFDVLDHLESTGMDSIIWIETPYRPKELVNIITHHSSTTVQQTKAYFDKQLKDEKLDSYDKKNLEAFKSWLMNRIEPSLRTNLYAKIDRNTTGPEVWMLLVNEVRSESYRYFENVKSELKALTLSKFPGDNVKDFTAAWTIKAQELETANLLEPHFLVVFVTALTKTPVQLFVLAMSNLLTRVLNYNKDTRFLSEEARGAMPADEVVTYRKIRMEADGLYQELLEAGEWTPSKTINDRQAAPQANIALKDTINALVQSAMDKRANSGKKSNKDKSKVKCFKCHQLGHYSNECPSKDNSPPKDKSEDDSNKDKKPNWKKIAPTTGAPESKQVTTDGKTTTYHWCSKCARWSLSHGTATHKEKQQPAANMAVDNSNWHQPLQPVPEEGDYGAW